MTKNYFNAKTNIIGFTVGIISSIMLWLVTDHIIELRHRVIFDRDVHEFQRLLQLKLMLYENSLKALKGTYEISNVSFGFKEFKKYNQQLTETFTSSIGVGFYRYVPEEKVKNFEQFMQVYAGTDRPEYSNFKLDPKQVHKHNLFVQYAFPFEEFSNALGRNILQLPKRPKALYHALKNDIGATSLIPILGHKPRKAIILFAPVFDPIKTAHLNLADEHNRIYDNLYGFVSIGFDINKLFSYITEHQDNNKNIDFKITDIEILNGKIIFQQEIFSTNKQFEPHHELSSIEFLSFGGRTWKIECVAKENLIPTTFLLLPYLAGFVGLILSLLITKQIETKKYLHLQNIELEAIKLDLTESHEKLKEVIDTIPMAFIISEFVTGKVILHNRRTIDLFRLTTEPEYTTDYYANPEQRQILIEEVKKQGGTVRDFEILLKKENGLTFWGLVSVKVSDYHHQKVLLITIHDITHRKQNEETLRILATTDGLTGLNNRRYFMELANKALIQANEEKALYSVLMLDIDHFKKVNDTYGHDIGDKAIQLVALTALSFLPKTSIIGRLGGEEFAVILPNTSLESAIGMANNFREQIAHQEVFDPNKNVRFSFTMSIGVSSLRCISCENYLECKENDFIYQMQSIEDLLKLADDALYQAKHNGRNQVCYSY